MCGLDERRIDMIYCGWISFIIVAIYVIALAKGIIKSNDITERLGGLITLIIHSFILYTLYFGMLK